ncbi:MAG: hypothetical protein HYR55_20275 [Acidobacteria bacterium]|nr:hypothetical protein [Acidobacteriota bacterium]MBI3656362.1 hypothetical protein [Acidobacteriota bacterium]
MKNLYDADIMARLAAMAEEYDPVMNVIEKNKNAQTAAFELVLAKGYYTEKIAIPLRLVTGWLEDEDRTCQVAIRRIISDATDRLDQRDYSVKEDQGLWDWTGDKR